MTTNYPLLLRVNVTLLDSRTPFGTECPPKERELCFLLSINGDRTNYFYDRLALNFLLGKQNSSKLDSELDYGLMFSRLV